MINKIIFKEVSRNAAFFALLFLIFNWNVAVGQDSILVTNDLEFKSGVYLNAESFRNDKPSLDWESVRYDVHANKDKRVIQFKNFQKLNQETKEQTPLNIKEIWGICVNGIPYIRVDIPSRNVSEFVALRTRGRICYFNYEGYEIKKVPMIIYNPSNGEPVLKKEVENKVEVIFEKILQFEDGTIGDFDLVTFKSWIEKVDKRLAETLSKLDETEAQAKLYKSMKIYNDRNPIYLKKK